MKTIASITEMVEYSDEARTGRRTIGLVPTMGSLHEGHLSLLARARATCDLVVTSIFVNPAQFAPGEDFAQYPRDLGRDSKLCEKAGSDVVFVPEADAMYPAGFASFVLVEGLSSILEGKFRPTHFRGVTTVVAKLLHIVHPNKTFFGQKDAQQCLVVGKMARELNFDTEIVVVPTVRDADGLAKSSRNVYLSPNERKDALVLNASLQLAGEMAGKGIGSVSEIIDAMTHLVAAKRTGAIDYIAVVDSQELLQLNRLERGVPALVVMAVRIGKTRLIDNAFITLT